MTAKVGDGLVVEGLSKKERELMGMDNSVVIAGGIRKRKGNGKNTIMSCIFKKKRANEKMTPIPITDIY